MYQPSDDSYLLAEQILKVAKGKKVLDVGSGSGILAQQAQKSGAKSVLASDIDLVVIKHLKSLGLQTIQSDLFEKIKGNFDLIVFNPPYLPLDKREPTSSRLQTTGGKEGDEVILSFLKQATSHLNKNGIILLLLSSLTPKNKIEKLIRKLDLRSEVLSEKNLFQEKLECWKIERLKT